MNDQTSKGAAVITGASAGIGATYAEHLARRGHDLILVARDGERLAAARERLQAETGVKVEVFKADLTDRADLARLEARLRTDPAIDMLVNNAGAALFGGSAEVDPEKLQTLVDLNVTALLRLSVAATANFVARGRGTIVNVGSVMGYLPEAGSPVYGATKAFVQHFTAGLNLEYAGKGVRFQAVMPGATYTEIWDRSGRGAEGLDPNKTMAVDELVAAALAGLDQGELVTIPSLPDPADWAAFQAARLALAPNASHAHPAPRYGVG